MPSQRPGTVWIALVVLAICAPHFTAQPPTADQVIENDRQLRQTSSKLSKNVATKPKWGFFGTIFQLIVQQVNDTKSAYTQISDLVNGQFTNDNTSPKPEINGTTETPKISRTEFLNILDRNLKGLNRLRNLEWREARKDSLANLRGYKDEIFRGKAVKNLKEN